MAPCQCGGTASCRAIAHLATTDDRSGSSVPCSLGSARHDEPRSVFGSMAVSWADTSPACKIAYGLHVAWDEVGAVTLISQPWRRAILLEGKTPSPPCFSAQTGWARSVARGRQHSLVYSRMRTGVSEKTMARPEQCLWGLLCDQSIRPGRSRRSVLASLSRGPGPGRSKLPSHPRGKVSSDSRVDLRRGT